MGGVAPFVLVFVALCSITCQACLAWKFIKELSGFYWLHKVMKLVSTLLAYVRLSLVAAVTNSLDC